MSKPNALGIEEAKVITLSAAHLSPATREHIDQRHGDILNGPSIAVRGYGYLVNSQLGAEDALEVAFQPMGSEPSLAERLPDLVLVQALARGLRAARINFDSDGGEHNEQLPLYHCDGSVDLPTADGWRDTLSTIAENLWGEPVVVADREVLSILEAGQTPGLYEDVPSL